MTIKITIFFIALGLLLNSCNGPESVSLVKTVYHIHKMKFGDNQVSDGGKNSTFFYDNEGVFTYSIVSNGTKTTRKQSNNNMTFEETDSLGNIIQTTIIFLDKEGREDSLIQKRGSEEVSSCKYFYNQDGFLSEEHQFVKGKSRFIIKHKPVQGNSILDSLIYSFAADTQMLPNQTTGEVEPFIVKNENMVIYKEYFLDRIRMPVNVNFGSTIKDRYSKNLEKRDVVINSGGDTVNIVNYRFTFDSRGRVISAVHELVSGVEYDSVAYTYY